MLGTLNGALEVRGINLVSDAISASATGVNELVNGLVRLTEIRVHYRLTIPRGTRESVDRALARHQEQCPTGAVSHRDIAGRRRRDQLDRRHHGAGRVIVALALALTLASSAPPDTLRGRVRPDTTRSQALGVQKRLLVYLPPSYERERAQRYPVAFYLHGAWGAEDDWVTLGHIDRAMDSLIAAGLPEMIVVLPDGDDGWYTTWNALNNMAVCRADTRRPEPAETYCVPWPKYDEYVARELVAHVDSSYRTLAQREHRGIGGLSMGGYGAVSLALRYPDVFAAAASHSGVLSPRYAGAVPYASPTRYAPTVEALRSRYSPALWALMQPAFGRDTTGWRARDPVVYARQLLGARERAPALFVDVGRDDPFLEQNRAFRADLRALGIRMRYAEWPGKHDWVYWRAHLPESLVWMAGIIAPETRAKGP
jgi:putative tributyrin esterase